MKKVFRALFGVSVATSVATGVVIFLFDLQTPRGLTIGTLYALPILISLMADRRNVTLALAVLFTFFVSVAYFTSPEIGVPYWIVAADRLLTVLTIWIVAILGLEVTSAKRRIRELDRLLTICTWTKQVRVDGEWIPVEKYLTEHQGVQLTHGLSREAAEQLLREEGLEGQ
jgi:hypothetical protein